MLNKNKNKRKNLLQQAMTLKFPKKQLFLNILLLKVLLTLLLHQFLKLLTIPLPRKLLSLTKVLLQKLQLKRRLNHQLLMIILPQMGLKHLEEMKEWLRES